MEFSRLDFAALLMSLVLEDVLATGSGKESSDRTRVRKCEPIGVGICQGIGYNYTGLPDSADGHEESSSQPDSDLQLRTFVPLIQYGCSDDLRFFLCAVYAPMCTQMVPYVIGPCRSVCERVRVRCEPVLRQFGFLWPAHLECSIFHQLHDERHLCMEGALENETSDDDDSRKETEFDWRTFPAPPVLPRPIAGGKTSGAEGGESSCRNSKFLFSNRSRSCLLRCDQDLSFAQKDKDLLDIWMTIWSSIAVLSTAFVAATYLVDDIPRFTSAVERHVVLMTSCYGICGVAYAVRVIAGRDVISCVPIDPPSDNSMVLPRNGLASTDCTVLFVVVYYFTMAGLAWWLLLTVTWLLVAGFQWTVDAIQRRGTCFHLVAWTIPGIQVIVVLVRKNIEPSEYSGMCHVTSTAPGAIEGLVLAPMVACLFVGAAFLCAGFVGYSRTKSRLNREHRSRSAKDDSCLKDRESIAKVATFALVCSIPLFGMTACVLIGYLGFERSPNHPNSPPLDGEEELRTEQKPVSVFLVEILLSIVVSIFSAFRSLLNSKQAWSGFLRRWRSGQRGRPSKDKRPPPPTRLSPSSPSSSSSFSPDGIHSHRGNTWSGGRPPKQQQCPRSSGSCIQLQPYHWTKAPNGSTHYSV